MTADHTARTVVAKVGSSSITNAGGGAMCTLVLGDQASGLDVGCGQLVSDAPAARVQHDPDAVALVQADLDEVIAAPKAAELRGDRRELTLGELGCRARR